MEQAVRITALKGVMFLDDANRKDEQAQLGTYCISSEIRKIRNGFARCLPNHAAPAMRRGRIGEWPILESQI